MTVTTNTNKTQPLGNGVTTSFPYSFRIYSASDLVVTSTVIATGIDTNLVLNTDYTVTGAGSYNGGNVVFSVAPAAGTRITIRRVMAVTQGADLRNQGAYFAETHEDVFDKLTMIDQQQQGEIDRSLKIPAADIGIDSTLPSSAQRANKVLGFDADGRPIMTTLVVAGSPYVTIRSFLDFMTEEEQADILAGTNLLDVSGSVQAAFNSDAYALDGGGFTYKCQAPIVSTKSHKVSGLKLTGALPTNGTSLKFQGSEGSAQSLPSNVAADAYSAAVVDGTLFAVNGWCFLKSTDQFSPIVSSAYGELCRIKYIVGNTLSFYDPVMVAYNTSAGASATPVTMLDGVELENVEIIGNTGTTGQTGVYLDRCDNVKVNGIKTTDCHYVHLMIDRCGTARVFGGSGARTGVTNGLNYGIVVTRGCYDVLVMGYTGNDMRHAVSVGGSEGISRSVRAYFCTANGALDAGFDSHPQAMFVDYSHNLVITSADASTGADGIICQAPNFKAIDNTVVGAKRHGIFHQPLINSAVKCTNHIVDNRGRTAQAQASSYLVVVTAGTGTSADIASTTVKDNHGGGWPGLINMYAQAKNIKWLAVNGNVATDTVTSRGIYVRADAGMEVSGGEISGNSIESAGAATEAIYLQGNGTGRVKNIGLGKNNTSGVGTGLRAVNSDGMTTDGSNHFANATPYSIDAASTGVFVRESNATIAMQRQAVTIAADAVTISQPMISFLLLDTEAAAATDDLSTISGGYVGQVITVGTTASSRDVTLKDGVGNLKLSGDCILGTNEDRIALKFDGTNWYEFGLRSLNGGSTGQQLTGSLVTDPANLAPGATQQFTVTVTGATLGDFALAAFSTVNVGIRWTAEVTGANTVTVTQENISGGAVDLASSTLTVLVFRQ